MEDLPVALAYWLNLVPEHDAGDSDEEYKNGYQKYRQRALRPDARVRDEYGRVGTIVAVMPEDGRPDAGDIWIRWNGYHRPQVLKSVWTTKLVVY